MNRTTRIAQLLSLAVLGFWLAACAEDVPGTSPPTDQLHYPIGVTLVRGATTADDYLVVCNSEFDQRYNAGTLMTMNVDALFSAAASADLSNPSTELPISSVKSVPTLCGDVAYQPRFDQNGAPEVGRGRLFLGGRLDRVVTMVDYDNGALSCSGTGDKRLAIDCTDGFVVETGNPDPYAMVAAPPIGSASQGLLAVGHFGNRAFPTEIHLYDIDKFARRAAEDITIDPLLDKRSGLLDGLSGLVYVPGPAIKAPLGTFVALALTSSRDQGVPLGTFELVASGDGYRLQAEPRVSALDVDDVTGGAGLVMSPDATRLYATVRIPEATREEGGQDRYNSAIMVVAVEDERLRFLTAFEIGEELGRPFLLERGGRRLIYVPDFRLDVIWVLDATRDTIAVVHQIQGRGRRQGEDGEIRTSLLSTPATLAYGERGNRALLFVSNFGNSTLAIIDVSDPDPTKHRLVARLGQDIDAFGESELEQ